MIELIKFHITHMEEAYSRIHNTIDLTNIDKTHLYHVIQSELDTIETLIQTYRIKINKEYPWSL